MCEHEDVWNINRILSGVKKDANLFYSRTGIQRYRITFTRIFSYGHYSCDVCKREEQYFLFADIFKITVKPR